MQTALSIIEHILAIIGLAAILTVSVGVYIVWESGSDDRWY